jgi:phosphoribosylglycinamide formyltransferase-1
MKLRIAILASHGGSNMQAIIDACADDKINGNVCVVICNNSKAGAVEKAEKAGIAAYHLSSRNYPGEGDLDEAILIVLKKYNVNIIALAGYMKKLGPMVLKEYKNRILNIHPALLPKYGGKGMYGLNVHNAVLEAGDKESGATVHLVNENYDEGGILSQVVVPVKNDDTPEILAARVLIQEHRLYPITLEKISKGEIKLY